MRILCGRTAALFIVSTLMMISTLVLIWIGVGCQFGFWLIGPTRRYLVFILDARYPISSADVFIPRPCWVFLLRVYRGRNRAAIDLYPRHSFAEHTLAFRISQSLSCWFWLD